MCNPIAIGALGLAGGVLQGIGGASQRMDAAQSYDMAAAGIDRDIGAEREATAYNVARTREGIARTQGSARAGFAANGLALDGSAAEVLRDSAIEGDLDVASIQWSSAEKIKSMEYERDVNKTNAKRERAAAPLALLSGVIGGAARFGSAFS